MVKYCSWIRVQLHTDFTVSGVYHAVTWILHLHLHDSGDTRLYLLPRCIMAYNDLFRAFPPCSVACCGPCLSFHSSQGRVSFALRAETDDFLVNPRTFTGQDLQGFATWMCRVVLNAASLSSRQRSTSTSCVKGLFPIGTLKFCEATLWSKLRVLWCDRATLERALATLHVFVSQYFSSRKCLIFFSLMEILYLHTPFSCFVLALLPHFC